MKVKFCKNYWKSCNGKGYEITFLPRISLLNDPQSYRALYLDWLLWYMVIEF